MNPRICIFLVWLFIILGNLFVVSAFGASQNYLQDVVVSEQGEETKIDIFMKLNQEIGKIPINLNQSERLIILSFNNAYSSPPQRTFTFTSSKINKISAIQITPSQLNLKIYYQNDFQIQKDQIRIEGTDKGIEVKIKRGANSSIKSIDDMSKSNPETNNVVYQDTSTQATNLISDSAQSPEEKSNSGQSSAIDLSAIFPNLQKDISKPNTKNNLNRTNDVKKSGVVVGSNVPSFMPIAFKIAISLSLIVVSLFGISFYLRRFGRLNKLSSTSRISIKTIATSTIAPRRKLYVVEIGNEMFLIGDGPNGLTGFVPFQVKPKNSEQTFGDIFNKPDDEFTQLILESTKDKGQSDVMNWDQREIYPITEHMPKKSHSEKHSEPANIAAIRERLAKLKKLP